MNRPWMPLYVGDYLADTAHLRAAESGAYIHLIMHYWRHDGLPDDDFQLASIARMTGEEWTRARPLIEPLFKAGRWKHKRIEAELAKAAQKVEAGRQGGLARVEQRTTKRKLSDPPSTPVSVIVDVEEASREIPIEKVDSEPVAARAREKPPDPAWPADAFEQFWERYPHKVGKQDAIKKFASAKRNCVNFMVLMAALDRYRADKPPDRAWCNPATWLNQGRWDDQPADSNLLNFGGGNGKTGNGNGARDSFGYSGLSARIRASQGHG